MSFCSSYIYIYIRYISLLACSITYLKNISLSPLRPLEPSFLWDGRTQAVCCLHQLKTFEDLVFYNEVILYNKEVFEPVIYRSLV